MVFVWPVNNHGIVLNLCIALYSDGCRYDTTGNPEGQYEPGSQELVLLNKLGITDLQEIENIEFDYLIQFQVALFDELLIDQQITSKDLCEWHRRWLWN